MYYCFTSSPLLNKFCDEMFRFKLEVLGDNLIKRYMDVFIFCICYNDFDISDFFSFFFAEIN